jgi:hypothetical protein
MFKNIIFVKKSQTGAVTKTLEVNRFGTDWRVFNVTNRVLHNGNMVASVSGYNFDEEQSFYTFAIENNKVVYANTNVIRKVIFVNSLVFWALSKVLIK